MDLTESTAQHTAAALERQYRMHRIACELFTAEHSLQNHPGADILTGTRGSDTLDIANTHGVQAGADYLLSDTGKTSLVHIAAIETPTRVRLAAKLTRNWDASARLSGSTLSARAQGGAHAAIGAQWISRSIELGADGAVRAVIIRRSQNTGEARLYTRNANTRNWTERPWTQRRTADAAAGLADYEYPIATNADGPLRLIIEGEAMDIRHIIALNSGTGLGGDSNPRLRPQAPRISHPADGANNIMETPTLSASDYQSPTGKPFATAQFQISDSEHFAQTQHDTEKTALSDPVPAGTLAAGTTYYLRCRVKDTSGAVSDWSAASRFTTAAHYRYINTPRITAPANGQSAIAEQPTFQTSAFAVTGGQDTHAYSEWQIRLARSNNILFGASSIHTHYTIPAKHLNDGQTQYTVRVRHIGNTLGASEWSGETHFKTRQHFGPSQTTTIATATRSDNDIQPPPPMRTRRTR
ncbi:hypothetical protein D5039_09800 [Verminephrobacter aporrectodeae subsp. tuberculatae]|uniref:Fibronectin type-III domain-containing protein n=1 Tax=Verminephrobacter aporrectodeae subsp. tuberculatae TaxID=1110392 RepID=A0ABT3KSY1_9BURK|nr:hypothetical protein [Verminephrobacter aporrectodeae]MCW5321428.1 hypothetical protein [Verminephrobacter aporrectodeae subsp. tuberculatae]